MKADDSPQSNPTPTASPTELEAIAPTEIPTEPPRPAKKPQALPAGGSRRPADDYYWLREREDAEVLAHLDAENAWTAAQLADTKELQQQLFDEIKGRIKQDDCSAPYRKDGWWYYSRNEEGKQYAIHCRKAVEGGEQYPASGADLAGAEVVLLDENALAEGSEFCSVTGLEISTDGNWMTYCVDFQGRRFYSLCMKDLRSGEVVLDLVPKMSGSVAWAADNRTLFYVKQDADTLRDHLVYKLRLDGCGHRVVDEDLDDGNTSGSKITRNELGDELIYDETDEQFYCYLHHTADERYLILHSSQTVCDESRYLRADDPDGEWKVFQPRQAGVEYSVDHCDQGFLVRTNWQAQNFRLMLTGDSWPTDSNYAETGGETAREGWREFIPHRKNVLLGDVDAFRDWVAIRERENAQSRLRVMRWDESEDHVIEQNEDAYMIDFGSNEEFDCGVLRYTYESMTTPDSVIAYDMQTRESKLLKQVEVLGDFDSSRYQSQRVWVTARDGAKVPVSLVYRRDRSGLDSVPLDGENAATQNDSLHQANGDVPKQPMPLLLYAYGAYGHSLDPYFSSVRLSLLDRGFIYAFAHVRGGQEMGRHWYEDGRLLKKQNTFNDFIDCAQSLSDQGWTSPQQLYAMGGSAGGLIMGVIYNQAPQLWNGVVAQVPFVDMMTTMEDDTIPLTTFEYDEWGNPANDEFYDYMLSYSPYDNIQAQDFPHMLVTSSLHDSQVQYWEPAKWVAKLRDHKTDDNLLLLKMEMNAGHGGVSGRFEQYKEIALEYAFVIKLAGAEL
jgi:oligopeptidase B